MKIALAQINTYLGDFEANSNAILKYAQEAKKNGALLVAFPELTLFGYPTGDLLENASRVAEQEKVLKALVKKLPPDIYVIFGAVVKYKKKLPGGKPYWNAAVLAKKGKIIGVVPKQLLPSYDIFDDTRFFESGEKTKVWKLKGLGKVVISVCEDMWSPETGFYKTIPISKIGKPDLIVNISASPFSILKNKRRLNCVKGHVKRIKAPFIYVNQVGAQDEIIFDGRSFAMSSKGELIDQAEPFKEDLLLVNLNQTALKPKAVGAPDIRFLRSALTLGIQDFCKKTDFKKIHLGLSGGIDSAVAAALAAEAIGAQNIVGVLLPGPFSSKGSITDSVALAKNLKIKTITVDINNVYKSLLTAMTTLSGAADQPTDLEVIEIAKQNIQSRIRGLMLMTYSNLHGSLLISTSNKSELATGYSTLYGDTCGGLAPMGDLLKNQVYELARDYNRESTLIPDSILAKAPSAELAPNQKDEDNLPPYDMLDQAVDNIVTKMKPATNPVEEWLVKKLDSSEFKRWQSPPILRVSEHAFGRGRRMPIAKSYRSASKSN